MTLRACISASIITTQCMQATANCDHWRAHAAFGPAGPAQRHSEYNSIMFVGSHPKIRPPTAKIQPVRWQKERLAVFHEQGRCNGVGACLHTKFISLQSQGSARLEIVMNGVKSCVASRRVAGEGFGSMLVELVTVYAVLFTVRGFYIMAVRQKDSLICCTIRNKCSSPGNSSLL